MTWLLYRALPVAVFTLIALLIGGYLYEKYAEARDDKRYPAPGRMVDVGGHHLQILCRGAGKGITVIFEQDAGAPSLWLWPIQDRVAEFAHVCTYDRAGFAWSEPVDGPRSLRQIADDLYRLLANAGVAGPYLLVGFQSGGLIVRQFAQLHHEQVAGVVLVDAPEEGIVFGRSGLIMLRASPVILGFVKFAVRFGPFRLWNAIVPNSAGAPPKGMSPEAADAATIVIRPAHIQAMMDEVRTILNTPEVQRRPGGLGTLGNIPLAVISRFHPLRVPGVPVPPDWDAAQRRLATLSTDSTLITVDSSAHFVSNDQPDVVFDAIHRVFASVRDGKRVSGL